VFLAPFPLSLFLLFFTRSKNSNFSIAVFLLIRPLAYVFPPFSSVPRSFPYDSPPFLGLKAFFFQSGEERRYYCSFFPRTLPGLTSFSISLTSFLSDVTFSLSGCPLRLGKLSVSGGYNFPAPVLMSRPFADFFFLCVTFPGFPSFPEPVAKVVAVCNWAFPAPYLA